MKSLRNITSKITKNENGESVPHLEITKVVLAHWNIVNKIISKILESHIDLFPIIRLVNY